LRRGRQRKRQTERGGECDRLLHRLSPVNMARETSAALKVVFLP
jgi:hypothetical protein